MASGTFVDRIDPFAKRSLKKKSKKSQGSSRYRNSQDVELQPLPQLKGTKFLQVNGKWNTLKLEKHNRLIEIEVSVFIPWKFVAKRSPTFSIWNGAILCDGNEISKETNAEEEPNKFVPFLQLIQFVHLFSLFSRQFQFGSGGAFYKKVTSMQRFVWFHGSSVRPEGERDQTSCA